MIDYEFKEELKKLDQIQIINEWLQHRNLDLSDVFDFVDYLARFETSLISNYRELDQYYSWYTA
jgi:hypothetical protein